MKWVASFGLFIIIACASLASASAQTPAAKPRETLTNEAIIKLTKARFKERTIIALIRTSPTAFDLSTARLIELKQRGVSERVMMEMIERQSDKAGSQSFASLRDDEFFRADDEAFFNSPPMRLDRRDEKSAKEDETSVFASRSGSKSKTSSRGLGSSGERAGETELLGTATVRIVRPPNETGGPKLERAAKLDNQAIIDLVQAGFSEGTILRKIESTQVEFDLSPQAVAELRQNRVSERIIKAMTEAMSDNPKP